MQLPQYDDYWYVKIDCPYWPILNTEYLIKKRAPPTLRESPDNDPVAGYAGPDLPLHDGVDALGRVLQALNVRLLLQVVQRFYTHAQTSFAIIVNKLNRNN